MLVDEDIYLSHHGVKGMRWGVRNEEDKPARTRWKLRSGKQKVAVVGGGFVAYKLGQKVTNKAFDLVPEQHQLWAGPALMLVDVATAVAGVKFTKNYLDRHNKKVKDLSGTDHIYYKPR